MTCEDAMGFIIALTVILFNITMFAYMLFDMEEDE